MNFMKNLLVSTLLLLLCITAWAQKTEADEEVHVNFKEPEKAKEWGFVVTPYALLAAQSTDVGGEKIRQSFSDLSSMTNAGFQIITGLRYKRWTLAYDGTFATLGVEEMQGPLAVDVEIIQRIFDLKLSYLIYNNFEISDRNVLDGWSLEVSAGGKYWKNDVDVSYSLIVNDNPILEDGFRELQEWWDLMIGVKTRFVISPKFLLSVAGNVGGFGIGDSSKFSHDFTYINSFKVSKHVLVNAGFRNFRYKRVDGEGEDELETVVKVLGPLLGVSIAF
jgi:hypothetical protein